MPGHVCGTRWVNTDVQLQDKVISPVFRSCSLLGSRGVLKRIPFSMPLWVGTPQDGALQTMQLLQQASFQKS